MKRQASPSGETPKAKQHRSSPASPKTPSPSRPSGSPKTPPIGMMSTGNITPTRWKRNSWHPSKTEYAARLAATRKRALIPFNLPSDDDPPETSTLKEHEIRVRNFGTTLYLVVRKLGGDFFSRQCQMAFSEAINDIRERLVLRNESATYYLAELRRVEYFIEDPEFEANLTELKSRSRLVNSLHRVFHRTLGLYHHAVNEDQFMYYADSRGAYGPKHQSGVITRRAHFENLITRDVFRGMREVLINLYKVVFAKTYLTFANELRKFRLVLRRAIATASFMIRVIRNSGQTEPTVAVESPEPVPGVRSILKQGGSEGARSGKRIAFGGVDVRLEGQDSEEDAEPWTTSGSYDDLDTFQNIRRQEQEIVSQYHADQRKERQVQMMRAKFLNQDVPPPYSQRPTRNRAKKAVTKTPELEQMTADYLNPRTILNISPLREEEEGDYL